uniref:Uncharacterized protein n=1 Tax=Arundo donax TaxID=35708 RepID=A0A0A8Y3W8_ARUDO
MPHSCMEVQFLRNLIVGDIASELF